jgi:predicted AAA+ superfamily ATPase
METHPLRGSIFETFVVAEAMKFFLNRGERPNLYFWRDSSGVEVALLIENAGRIIPVEIKSGKTIARDFFSSLEKWMSLAGAMALDPTLIYGGKESYFHKGIQIQSWQKVNFNLQGTKKASL